MKICLLFLFAFTFQMMALNSNAQDAVIELKTNSITIGQLINEIEKQTDYLVVYSNREVDINRKINVQQNSDKVSSYLNTAFSNTDIGYNFENDYIVLSKKAHQNATAIAQLIQAAQQQGRTIKGRVTDENGESVIGANIVEKGTTNGTVTDIDGFFSLLVGENDFLQISYIGYLAQEVNIAGRNTVNVILQEDTKTLDEVVVVGYGIQRKSVVTGAITSVKASDLETLPVNRIEQALQGRTSGITIASQSGQPGSASTVRVRGLTSFNDNNPLWVVDGVVLNADAMGYLNQSDIESIEVLKDASSQAIYGARAAAGVILVTTKKGQTGAMRVNYNGSFGISAPAKKLDLLNATDYGTLRNEASLNAGGEALFTNPSSLGAGTDWQALIFNNSAKRQNHEISISGGNDRSTYYASFGYLDQEGIIATDISRFKRINIRLNSEHKITRWLKIGQNLGYGNQRHVGLGFSNTEMGGLLTSAINLDPVTPAIISNPAEAAEAPYAGNPVMRDPNGNPYAISKYVVQEMTNPLAYIQTRLGNNNWSDNIIGNAYAEITPVEGLTLRSTLGTKLAFWGTETFFPEYYLNAVTYNAQSSFQRDLNRVVDWNVENIISYARSFQLHNFMVLAGQGAYVDSDTRGLNVTYYNIPVDNFDDASHNYSVPADSRSGTGSEGVQHKVTSLFARLNYNYDEKYLLEALIRRDGSSRFGTNNRYGYFPSFSLGWVMTRESFLEDNQFLNSLKVRGGYGVVGNDNIGDFAFLSTIGSGRNYPFGTSDSYRIGYSPNAPSNPNLRWEETRQTNIGFDMVFLDNFNLTFDWFKKVTADILQYPRIPAYIGAISNPASNVADMQNMGVELELGYRKKIGNVDLSVNGNVSYLENEVTNLGRGIEYLSGGQTFQSSTYPITRTAVGQAYNSFFGFQALGVFQNQQEIDNWVNSQGVVIQPNAVPGDFKWADTNDDGQISEEDRVFIGDPTPNWTFGATVNLAWKGFDMLVFGQGAAGNKIFQGLRRLDIANANYQEKALGRWTGEGSTNSYPRLSNTDPNRNFSNPSNFYLEDGSYFRLKVLQLGYSLPSSTIQGLGLQNLRVYIMSENLLTFTGYTGYDPEIGGGVMSIDRGFYPQARSFMIGLNLGF